MKKLLIASGVILSLAIAAPSFAAINAGAYVGLGAGIGGMDTPELPANLKGPNYSENIGGGAGRIYAGYLLKLASVPSLMYGVETGYTKYSNNKYYINDGLGNNLHWKYSGYNADLLGVVKYTFVKGFNAFVKGGAAYTGQKVTMNGSVKHTNVGTQSKARTKVLPKVELGAGYDFTEHFGVSTSYSHIFGNKPRQLDKTASMKGLANVATVNTLLVNAEYHF